MKSHHAAEEVTLAVGTAPGWTPLPAQETVALPLVQKVLIRLRSVWQAAGQEVEAPVGQYGPGVAPGGSLRFVCVYCVSRSNASEQDCTSARAACATRSKQSALATLRPAPPATAARCGSHTSATVE